MPEKNTNEIHPMMKQKVIGSSTYKSTDEEPFDYIDQANYLISYGYFTDTDTEEMSVRDLADKLEKIADENNKKPTSE